MAHCHRVLGQSYDALRQFCVADWRWPADLAQKGRQVSDIVSAARARASEDTFRGGASEILTIYRILRHFAERVIAPTGRLAREVASLCAWARAVDTLLAARDGRASPDDLRAAVRAHCEAWKLAYPAERPKPKMHFAFHVVTQLQRDGMLLSCFTHERKHQCIKGYMEAMRNTRSFEKGVLARVLGEHVRFLCDNDTCLRSSFLHPGEDSPLLAAELTAWLPHVRTAAIADAVVHMCVSIKGDVAFLQGGGAAFVAACVECAPTLPNRSPFYAIVYPCRLEERLSPTSAKWRRSAMNDLVHLSAVTGTAIWSPCDNDIVLAL